MVNFIVDSTFGLTKSYASTHNVRVVGLTLVLGEKEYKEGYSGEWDEFFTDYTSSRLFAKTSQPSPEAFMQAIDDILALDSSAEIIILTIGDRLSGTVYSARIAAMQYPDTEIAVIDTKCASAASYLILDELIKLRDMGADFNTVAKHGEEMSDRASMLFIPSTLVELARGGRVNKLLSRFGTMLNIKPVFEFSGNNVTVRGRPLGLKRAVSLAVSYLPKDIDRIAIVYIHDGKNVDLLRDRLSRDMEVADIDVIPVSPILGAHVGVGTVGLASIGKNKKDK